MLSTILSYQRLTLLVLLLLLGGCGHLTTQCEPPLPIPKQLTRSLEPLRTVGSEANLLDTMQVQLHNTQQCGVCYIRYNNLIKAVKDRQED